MNNKREIGRRIERVEYFAYHFHFLYCSPVDGKLIPYLEDNSANGTFVNKIKVEKGVRRTLRNGDHVALINPDLGDPDIEKASFYIHLFVEDGVVNKNTKAPRLSPVSSENGEKKGLFSLSI